GALGELLLGDAESAAVLADEFADTTRFDVHPHVNALKRLAIPPGAQRVVNLRVELRVLRPR
ncbi:MAG: hypothetical protein JO057_29855, partial [Chloroflexi bacterium]|nr:hypothetical protein [Chloroflexota bacterium]